MGLAAHLDGLTRRDRARSCIVYPGADIMRRHHTQPVWMQRAAFRMRRKIQRASRSSSPRSPLEQFDVLVEYALLTQQRVVEVRKQSTFRRIRIVRD